MGWLSKKSKESPSPLEDFQFTIDLGERWIALPQPGEEPDVGAWARETLGLYSPNFENAEGQSEADLELVGAQLAGWAQVHMDTGPSTGGVVIVAEAQYGVEAYVSVRGFEWDGTFTGPDDVASEDLHDTPVVGERSVEVVDLPSGRAAHVFSIRESVFGGVAGQVRDEEWYVFLEPQHIVMLIHAEWLNVRIDTAMGEELRDMAGTLTVTPKKGR